MVNDFETVRYGLLDSEAEDELRPDVSAAYAALARIEDRYATALNREAETEVRLEAELARLREALDRIEETLTEPTWRTIPRQEIERRWNAALAIARQALEGSE